MRRIVVVLVAGAALIASIADGIVNAAQEAAPVFVKEIPPGYRDWKVVSVAHEAGELNDIRAVLGKISRSKRIGMASFRFRKARSLAE